MIAQVIFYSEVIITLNNIGERCIYVIIIEFVM